MIPPNKKIYSTTEGFKTGERWIDGKSIYKKVIISGEIGKNSAININVDFSDIDAFINVNAVGIATNGSIFPLSRSHKSSFNYQSTFYVNKEYSRVEIETGIAVSFEKCYIFLEYTKVNE